ncbi:MAG: hypothetical protein JW969_03140 [Spirochaetales bacterium]|nr:hypothetical protein [Spirochaetales bacterium]
MVRQKSFYIFFIFLVSSFTLLPAQDYYGWTYGQILDTGVKPGIKPAYKFPVSKQHHYGCYGFSVKHLAKYKYKLSIDVNAAEKKIGKDRNKLWSGQNIGDFLDLYKLKMNYFSDVGTLFNFLIMGEPVIIQYKWPVDAKNWVGHFVVAYSFDKQGVWVSDSIANKCLRIPYRSFLKGTGTQTLFAFGILSR